MLRVLLFMAEQVFLTMGEVWSMYNTDSQWTVGERGSHKPEKNFNV